MTLFFLVPALILTGLLAGISLDKALVQLPARHRLGVVAFSAFSRVNDLGSGLVVYALLGVGSALLTLLAGVTAWLAKTPLSQAAPLAAAVLLAVLHSLATSRAAPNMLRLRHSLLDEPALARLLDRFTFWHNIRAVLQLLHFLFLVWALIALI
jgi:hypothetical protein